MTDEVQRTLTFAEAAATTANERLFISGLLERYKAVAKWDADEMSELLGIVYLGPERTDAVINFERKRK